MRFERCRQIVAMSPLVIIILLQGCAQQTPGDSGVISGGQSNTTFSGYTRAGVIFPGR
jgi:hypothetical protein